MFEEQISAIILSGGKSIRMGEDKNDLIYCGKTLLNFQIDKVKSLGIDDILISGYKGKCCNEKVIADEEESKGPLSGIYSCLKYIKNDRALVLSVDVPLVSINCLKNLIFLSLKKNSDVCLISHEGKLEPLIAVYKKNILNSISEVLKNKNHCVMALLDKLKTDKYISNEDNIIFSNINFKSDYDKLLEVKN